MNEPGELPARSDPPWPTARLFGLDFVTDATIDELRSWLLDDAETRRDDWRCVVTPNVDHLVRYDEFTAEAATAQHSYLVLPDGMPIVWASRLLRRPLASRLTGSDLFAALWPELVARRIPTVVVASSSALADRLQEQMGALVRCVVPPRFDVADNDAVTSLVDEVTSTCQSIHARFCIIGISMPKHHLIANHLRRRWADSYASAPVVLLLGAAPELYFGLARRAPQWMQRTGSEWLYRLAREPRRLAKRYLIEDVQFVRLLVDELRSSPTHRRRYGRRQVR